MGEMSRTQGEGSTVGGQQDGSRAGIGGFSVAPAGNGAPAGGGGYAPGEDAVTGTMNVPAFARAFASQVIPTRYEDAALWYVDIRNFRSINPKYGFMCGNALLKAVAETIDDTLAHGLPIARLGADRFIFVTAGIDHGAAQAGFDMLEEHANDIARRTGIATKLTLTGGVYYLREHDYKAGNHLRALDYASIAHRNARNARHSLLVTFTQEDLDRDNRRIAIEQSIDEALADGQIEVWYQPQVDYIYGEIIGAEALARWKHPELGWISPAEFIPVLENCGKVHDLDLFVWEEACRNAGRWRSASDGNPVPISVNVSRVEMFEEGFVAHFLDLQRKYDLPDGSLRLEVTESAFVEEAERLYSIIEEMRANKMRVEMDDFGSGLSSLNMLKDVPVDVVKLDMGFMRSAVNEDRGGVVLGSVIRMLQGLDTPIIAEGVETLEQAEMLKNMGCHLMQGFHFSRPMPLEEFEDFVSSNNATEKSARRTRRDSHLDELTSFDPSSSYLFNNVMGPTMFFFADDGASESILVNDEFYEACGLERSDFGNAKINPIEEIEPEARATLWRAAAEAREHGAAPCRGEVRLTKRWIDCIMRYLGPSARGEVYSLNIYRWGALDANDGSNEIQAMQDNAWAAGLLDDIMPSGFVKCAVDEALTFAFASPRFIGNCGLSEVEFSRRFHNSFAECVVADERANVVAAVRESLDTRALIECDFGLYHGFKGQRPAKMFGRVRQDSQGEAWLYGFIAMRDDGDESAQANALEERDNIIPFDYDLVSDTLVIKTTKPGEQGRDIVMERWLEKLDTLPDNIAPSSASKVLATVRDLKHHASSGFTDLKCNLRGGRGLRWYHINYTCESDADGNAVMLHGYAQDADDQMGSAKWWRRQAEIDHLTGLLNRNAVEQEINLAMRTHGVGMMFMIDLDSFKRVNDDFGHLAGDALLRDVAKTLSDHFREGDVLGRYGGDEFVAFVPIAAGDPVAIAEHRCADLIASISSIQVADGVHAGCSVGVAISHNREATFYDLLEVADQAMYQSKLAGKGRFTLLDL